MIESVKNLLFISFSIILLNCIHAEKSFAAEDIEITGKIVDDNNLPIPYATVGLYRIIDSTLIDGVLTNDQGYFSINTQNIATKFLKISFLGFSEKIINDITLAEGKVNIGTITLKAESFTLDAVQITGEKSQMNFNLDKRTYNVAKDLTAKGGSAIDILENVPSVNVDVEGNVSLRGSEAVNILINGKPSGLIGLSSSDALRQLQGSLIEKIEVITNPSARYNAQGGAGIINIVLNKNQKSGVNGSFELSTGWPHNHSAAYNLNYRKKWINLFSNYSVHYRQSPGFSKIDQQYDSPDTSYHYKSDGTRKRGGLGNTIRFGADVFIKELNTLTFSGLYRYSKGNNESIIKYMDLDDEDIVIQQSTRDDQETETKSTGELEINYEKKFAKNEDQDLSASFRFFRSNDNENSNIIESSELISISDQIIDNKEFEQNFAAQIDYVHPFRSNYQFEAGSQATFRTIENNYTVQQKNEQGDFEVLPDFDNVFVFEENILAFYSILSGSVKPYSWQIGLRVEHSDVTTDLKKTNSKNINKYLDFFPSAHFSYEFPKQNTIQLGYSRRIDRPRFWSLIPFVGFSDSRNFYTGNQNLQPSYIHSLELGYMKTFDKASILGSVYYRNTVDGVERIISQNDDDIELTIFSPVNVSTINDFGLELNLTYTPFETWTLSGNGNFFRSITKGDYLDQNLDANTYRFTTQLTSKNTFFNKLDIQNTLNYTAPFKNVQGKQLAIYSWNIGASIDVFNKNGTLTFSGQDILNSNKRRGFFNTEFITTYSERQRRQRQFLLTFTYRLNQSKAQASKNKLSE